MSAPIRSCEHQDASQRIHRAQSERARRARTSVPESHKASNCGRLMQIISQNMIEVKVVLFPKLVVVVLFPKLAYIIIYCVYCIILYLNHMPFISYFTLNHSMRTSSSEQKIMCWRQLSHTKGAFIKPRVEGQSDHNGHPAQSDRASRMVCIQRLCMRIRVVVPLYYIISYCIFIKCNMSSRTSISYLVVLISRFSPQSDEHRDWRLLELASRFKMNYDHRRCCRRKPSQCYC